MFLRRKKRRLRKSRDGKIARILAAFAIDAVCDIGANIGQTRDSLRRAGYRGRIVSFEPGPEAHATLVSRARSDPAWEIAPRMALGARAGEDRLNLAESSDMSGLRPPTADLLAALPGARVQGQAPVTVAPLDSVFDAHFGPTERVFVKIDTQGHERAVLDGSAESLTRIVGLQLELSLLPLYEDEETYLSFLNDLHGWGFAPYMLIETNFSQALARQLQIDALFMREFPPGQ